PSSVGSTSPAPDSTTHLHIAHVPPPPQAEARNIFSLARVVNNELPADTVRSFSPLILISTGPDCTNFFWASRSISTSNRMTSVNAIIEDRINIETRGFYGYKYRRRVYKLHGKG